MTGCSINKFGIFTTLSYPALPNYTSPYPSLVVPYLYTSALSSVTTTKFKFKFYSIMFMSPPERIPHFALSIVTAYPKSYLSIYNPSLSDLSKQIPTHLNRHTCTYPTFRNAILVLNHTYLAYPYLHYQHHSSTPTMFQYLVP